MEILFIGILLIVAALLDSERDTIQYKPQMALKLGPWWVERNYLLKRSSGVWRWMLKYPLSFMIDGWHFCKSVSLILLLGLSGDWSAVVGGYVVYGLIFNLGYDY